MTIASAFTRVCRSAFSGSIASTDCDRVALSAHTDTDLARIGTSGAAILHSKLSGLYYS